MSPHAKHRATKGGKQTWIARLRESSETTVGLVALSTRLRPPEGRGGLQIRLGLRLGRDWCWSVSQGNVHCTGPVEVLSDGPGLLQWAARDSANRLHGRMPPEFEPKGLGCAINVPRSRSLAPCYLQMVMLLPLKASTLRFKSMLGCQGGWQSPAAFPTSDSVFPHLVLCPLPQCLMKWGGEIVCVWGGGALESRDDKL